VPRLCLTAIRDGSLQAPALRRCRPSDEPGDRFHIEEYDDEHSMDEDRWITTSSHPADRRIVLRIVWTPGWRDGLAVTRIICARPATRLERIDYEDEIAGR